MGAVFLVLVAAGLAATVVSQFRPSHRLAHLLDVAAVMPQWRFYALPSLTDVERMRHDFQLIVRDADDAGTPGPWRAVAWHGERSWHAAMWNAGQTRAIVLSNGEDLVRHPALAEAPGLQQSILYLSLLRYAMAAPANGPAAHRQFAIVHTAGRGDGREVAVDFVSAFHRC